MTQVDAIEEQPLSKRQPAGVQLALGALSLSMLLSALGTSIANVGLPAFAEAFDASFQGVQWIVLAYLLAVTTLIVSAGRLGDIVGRKRLLLIGLATFTAASLVCGAAPNLEILIAARAIQGVGAAIMMPLTMAFVGQTVSSEKTGSAMGLLGTMSAVGTALGPSLGGVLIAAFGWRALFLLMVPIGGLALAVAYYGLPADSRESHRDRHGFDLGGTVLLGLALAAYALAMTVGRGNFGATNLALLGVAAVGTGLFLRAQSRASSPLIRLSAFAHPALGAGLAMSALVTTVIMATLVVGPFYLSRTLGLDAALVGLVLSAGPVIAALTGVPAGRLVDRIGPSRMTIIGLVAMTAGSIALSVLPASLGIPGYVFPIAIVTAGYALFQAANNTSVMKDAGADQKGVISGLLNLSRNLGLMTGAALMGALFAASAINDSGIASAEAVARGMRVTFAVAAAVILSALCIAIASSRRQARSGSMR